MHLLETYMKSQKETQKEAPQNTELMGGRALISQILLDCLNPRCHPPGEENKVVIAPGLLTGTMAPCSGRLSIDAKSLVFALEREKLDRIFEAEGQELLAPLNSSLRTKKAQRKERG